VRRLILNADDFGLTDGVNRAVIELHLAGVLTSATLMARAAATKEAIDLARATPTLGVGCHVVLVDGEPVLSPTQDIPHLADPVDGCFRASVSDFLLWLESDSWRSWPYQKHAASEIEAETAAQIALLQSKGVRLTHIDTHKHVHMFPAVLRPVLRAAKAAGIRAVRNPFEPAWSRRAARRVSLVRRAEVSLLRLLEPSFRRIVAEEGFATTDGTIGVLATGKLDGVNLSALLNHLPDGTWELVTHPGYNDGVLARVQTRLRASRETERVALLSMERKAAFELVDFSHLPAG
jgi:hopanoid biosynthesis associated protein HpnK